jgi:plastocyanin
MKTILLCIFSLTSLFITAQTTFDLDWEQGVNGPDASFTIETGDTMRWTWVNANPHSVTSLAGSAETFDSGIITGQGTQFSYTFLVEGTNNYHCVVHPGSMFGTITVEESLSIEDKFTKNLSFYPNPVEDNLTITSLHPFDSYEIYDLNGKRVLKGDGDGVFTQLNLSFLNSGIYLALIKSGELQSTFKLIKK